MGLNVAVEFDVGSIPAASAFKPDQVTFALLQLCTQGMLSLRRMQDERDMLESRENVVSAGKAWGCRTGPTRGALHAKMSKEEDCKSNC